MKGALLIICLCCLSPVLPAVADDHGDDEIVEKLNSYIRDYARLGTGLERASKNQLKETQAQLERLNVKYEFYCQAQQDFIVADDSLMNLMAEYHELRQQTDNTIRQREQVLQAYQTIQEAEQLIASKDSLYSQMQKRALLLSQTPKTAQQLEALKGEEQLVFTEIEKQFNAAKEAIEDVPLLENRLKAMETKYIELKNASTRIQEANYTPFLQRIKDYLLSIAAVGFILMVINMIHTKIQAFRQMRESARQMKEMMRKANNDYPQI
ncbi:MAG TPA: hypothetical protein H9814_08025 [Candidatus Bacteroides merdigallinarum]|uniref:Uncharacterized protein n=1 Tax=Candidatus Bacteroides merdigallinarum TaxID=2838473 RepID=A0A9D2E9X3_9BACE|nr:hypothetical protein [Candidatus Bacteroides merdigallinarum]